MSVPGGTDTSSRGLNDKPEEQDTPSMIEGAHESTQEKEGGFSATGFTETLSPGAGGDPSDEENMSGATTGAASAPGYGVLNTDK